MKKINMASEIEMKVSKTRKMEMLEKVIGVFDSATYDGSNRNKEHWIITQNGKVLEHDLIFSKRYRVWVDYYKYSAADVNRSFSKMIVAARKKQWNADELSVFSRQTEKYYLAYGSNLNLEQMAYRCPNATVVGDTVLNDYRLLFRGMPGNTHATVERAKGYNVPVLVWKITDADEAALDVYEGFPRYYYKEYVSIRIGKSIMPAMLYIMTDGYQLGAPSRQYYNIIQTGYKTFGFDMVLLETALKESCLL